jgi:hypothetical protein
LRADGTIFRLRATASSAAVPEPGTLALLGAAGALLAGAAAVRRRSR